MNKTILSFLVADDSEINRVALKALFRELECPAMIVSNGYELLQEMKRRRVDIVLLDILLPGLSGFEVAREIRSNNDYRNVDIYAFSAMCPEQEILEKCDNVGMNGYIEKPLTFEKIKEIILRKFKNMGESCAKNMYPNLSQRRNLMKDLIGYFMNNYKYQLDELRLAVKMKNVDDITLISHKLKGELEILGLDNASKIAGKMQYLNSPDDLPNATCLLVLLEADIRKSVTGLCAMI